MCDHLRFVASTTDLPEALGGDREVPMRRVRTMPTFDASSEELQARRERKKIFFPPPTCASPLARDAPAMPIDIRLVEARQQHHCLSIDQQLLESSPEKALIPSDEDTPILTIEMLQQRTRKRRKAGRCDLSHSLAP